MCRFMAGVMLMLSLLFALPGGQVGAAGMEDVGRDVPGGSPYNIIEFSFLSLEGRQTCSSTYGSEHVVLEVRNVDPPHDSWSRSFYLNPCLYNNTQIVMYVLGGNYYYRAKADHYLAVGGTVYLDGYWTTVQLHVPGGLGGDASNDNTIGIVDFNLIRNSYGRICSDGGYNPAADINQDCYVSLIDYNMVAQHSGNTGYEFP